MAFVTITCPQTGGQIPTGIETDEATFQRLPDTPSHLQCPHCGQIHTWSKADAVLRETPPGGPGKG
jgi:hypothetical protein